MLEWAQLWAHSAAMGDLAETADTTTTKPRTPTAEPPNLDADGLSSLSSKLNWLRAGVLGANDGIVATAGLVMGVAGASASSKTLVIAGLAAVVAGALSMAGGEYVSVSSQKDTEIAALAKERLELATMPDQELDELAQIYRRKGISEELAHQVAAELTAYDALAAHAEAELHIDPNERTSPWHAALASCIAFTLGAVIPLLLIVLSPTPVRVVSTLVGVVVALLLTGLTSAHLGGGPKWRPMLRNVVVGLLAMGLTYLVGHLVGGTGL